MKHCWLKHNEENQKSKLIIFFNGWGMDKTPFEQLESQEYDVIMLYDYSNLSIEKELQDKINSYADVTMIGWSFGVWALSQVFEKFNNVIKSIAICGTSLPIDDEFGISKRVFDLTLKSMSESARESFWQNMFRDEESFKTFKSNQPKRLINEQIDELKNVKEIVNSSKNENDCENMYDFAIICNKDKIFPAKNQINFWQKKIGQNKAKIIELEEGHFPFYRFRSWDEIVNLCN